MNDFVLLGLIFGQLSLVIVGRPGRVRRCKQLAFVMHHWQWSLLGNMRQVSRVLIKLVLISVLPALFSMWLILRTIVVLLVIVEDISIPCGELVRVGYARRWLGSIAHGLGHVPRLGLSLDVQQQLVPNFPGDANCCTILVIVRWMLLRIVHRFQQPRTLVTRTLLLEMVNRVRIVIIGVTTIITVSYTHLTLPTILRV